MIVKMLIDVLFIIALRFEKGEGKLLQHSYNGYNNYATQQLMKKSTKYMFKFIIIVYKI